MQSKSKIILGIDPGTITMGYGLIEVTGPNARFIDMGALKMHSSLDAYIRLRKIQEKVLEVISIHQPQIFAIEAPFYGKNVQSMLKLGRAQGVAIAAAMQAGLEVIEYSPKRIKQSITGNGNAAKDQVMKMLHSLLQIEHIHDTYDATDALAAAMCHHIENRSPLAKIKGKKQAVNWEEFIRLNPGKVL